MKAALWIGWALSYADGWWYGLKACRSFQLGHGYDAARCTEFGRAGILVSTAVGGLAVVTS